MHRILVEERKWISEARFLHALNFCMLLPGPEAQQLATYVGWLLHGTRGGVVAGTLFVVPGAVVILTLSTLYALFQETAWLASLFFGLKAAVLAIVIEAVIRIGRRALKGRLAVALAGSAFVAIYVFHVPFPAVVAAAGLVGFLTSRVAPGAFAGSGERAAGIEAEEAEPHLTHVEPSLGRAVRVILVGGVLWAGPVVVLGAVFGWVTIYPSIAVFFSKMAVVTFGGAYAVLAYVAQAAVATLGWLKPGEMLDGLAMAETTPGPLILVLVYVGYLAAFRNPGGLAPLAGGFAGALLTIWVTFVPCFLWIFLGAPYVEKLRGNRALSAALGAITAAVVGVILNLAVFLGLHVLFGTVGSLSLGPATPAWPVWSSLDPAALGLLILAAFVLFRLKLGIVPTLGLSAGLGLALRSFAGI
jgi:chromate transporter